MQILGGNKMKTAIVASAFAFVTYLLLTAGSGDIGLWSPAEIAIGIVLGIIIGPVTEKALPYEKKEERRGKPGGWLLLPIYLVGPFFISMAKANIDVAYRVITGRIRPGIMRISPGLKRDISITALGNSITLTPGTLTVDVDEKSGDLFVHWINVRKGDELYPRCSYEHICGTFPKWIRRMFE